MNENKDHKDSRRSNRNLSLEEKRNYYAAWKESGMSRITFCKMNGISKSALYQWSKEFNKECQGSGFSPLVAEKPSPLKQADTIQLTICVLNQMQISIAMPEHRLVSFIQELGYATAIIR